MRLWKVIDPRLRGCAFCEGHGYGRGDAVYHAEAWHGTDHTAGAIAARVPVIGRRRPRRITYYNR